MIKRNDLNLNNLLIKNDKLKIGDTLVNNEKIKFIKNIVVKLNNIRCAIAEIGVYKGGMAKIVLENMDKNDKLYLFDTFEGIPNTNEYDNIVINGDFNDTSYDEILKFFKTQNNVYIYKGIFPQDTSNYIENEKFKLIHLDVDTYISYKESLEFIYNKVIAGGYIIFDDYNEPTCIGATKAINEFFKDKAEKIEKNNMSYYIVKI